MLICKQSFVQAQKHACLFNKKENVAIDYYEGFKAYINTVRSFGGVFGYTPGLTSQCLQLRKRHVTIMLKGAKNARHKKPKDDIVNNLMKKLDNYQK